MPESVRATTAAHAGSPSVRSGEGVDRKRLAWQAGAIVSLPAVVWPFAEVEWELLVLYLLILPILLYVAWRFHRFEPQQIIERGNGRTGADGHGFIVLIFVGISAFGVYRAQAEDSLSRPPESALQVSGLIPADHVIVGKGRSAKRYLKIDDVLLSCHNLYIDDCPQIRRHAGRQADIRYQRNHRHLNVVYEVYVDGHPLRQYAEQHAFYLAERQRKTRQLLVVLLTLGLPQLWLWQRVRRMFREASVAAGDSPPR